MVSDYQVRYYKAYLDGKVTIPPELQRILEAEKEHADRTSRGIAEWNAHVMTISQWSYIDKLASEAGVRSYDPITKVMYEVNIQDIRNSPHGFRNFRIEKIDAESFWHIPVETVSKSDCFSLSSDVISEEERKKLAERNPHWIIKASSYKSDFHLPGELRG